jgi:hypothetical protein
MVYGAGISIVNMLEYTDTLALEVCVCVASGSMHALAIKATAPPLVSTEQYTS